MKKKASDQLAFRVRYYFLARAPQTTRERFNIQKRQTGCRRLLATFAGLARSRLFAIAGIAQNEVTVVTPPRLSAKVSRVALCFFIIVSSP